MRSLPFLLSLPLFALAKTVTYTFKATWITANPDGQFERRTMGINGQWPVPVIHVSKGDRLIVDFENGLEDEPSSLHFHGIFQNGTNYMDGPVGVTQCAVPPGEKIRYDFVIDQPGTYWYHAHYKGQYPDGLRGALIVHDDKDPHKGLYDREEILTLSDWYHDSMKTLIGQFLSYTNPTGAEPVPQAALLNDTQNLHIPIKRGETLKLRIMNIAAFAAMYLWFEGHTMRVVEVDGVYVEPYEATMLYLTAAQRVSVLLEAKNSSDKNYAFVSSMDQDLFDVVPPGLNPNVTGWLVYDEKAPLPMPQEIPEFIPMDDTELVPVDKEPLLKNPTKSFALQVAMDNLGDGANYAFFNDITYLAPKVPTLFTALTSGKEAKNAEIYGVQTNAMVLEHGEIVEIVVNNADPGKHPFHLHGHNFQVVYRSEDEAGVYNASSVDKSTWAKSPMRRDTVLAPPNGNVVLRFRADNPGIWLFHCHLEWHMVSGLAATFIEAPLALQSQKIPEDHLKICRSQKVPIAGNAAGNTEDLLDLDGQVLAPKRLPNGFTARGIVALVFSCLAAFLGLAVVGWYGMAEAPHGTIE